jgi:hypothetical protein
MVEAIAHHGGFSTIQERCGDEDANSSTYTTTPAKGGLASGSGKAHTSGEGGGEEETKTVLQGGEDGYQRTSVLEGEDGGGRTLICPGNLEGSGRKKGSWFVLSA